jgi:carbon monoxide dehydrogenase subunit G
MIWQSITPSGARFWRIEHNARMRCSYGASVAEPVDRIWASLAEVDTSLAALSGVTLARDGDAVAGTLKCTLGSAQITYRLTAGVESRDAEARTAVVVVAGKEARGSGTLTATLAVEVRAEDSGARVALSAEIEATGRGEAADDAAWCRVLSRLLDAHLATLSVAAAPADAAPVLPASPAAPAAPPRPALALAEPDSSDPRSRLIIGAVVALLLLLLRRRRRRRAEGESNGGE